MLSSEYKIEMELFEIVMFPDVLPIDIPGPAVKVLALKPVPLPINNDPLDGETKFSPVPPLAKPKGESIVNVWALVNPKVTGFHETTVELG